MLDGIATNLATIIVNDLHELYKQDRYEIINSFNIICREAANIVSFLLTSRSDDQYVFVSSDGVCRYKLRDS